MMTRVISITEVKAKLSEIINRIIYNTEEVIITKKGKQIAALIPFEKYSRFPSEKGEGLICAKGALADMEQEINNMTERIYTARVDDRSREVNI